MTIGAVSFLSPFVLMGLVALPIIWWLLRTTPPSPVRHAFPPTKILRDLLQKETSAAHSPWWLTLLRLIVAALVIFALAQPVLNSAKSLLSAQAEDSPLIVVIDDGWQAANQWQARKIMLHRLFREAQAQDRLVLLVSTAPQRRGSQIQLISANEGFSMLDQFVPTAFSPDRVQAFEALNSSLDKMTIDGQLKKNRNQSGTIFYLSDGLSDASEPALTTALNQLRDRGYKLHIATPTPDHLPLGLSSKLGSGGALIAMVEGAPFEKERLGFVVALSAKDEILGRVPFKIEAGQSSATAKIELPLELRNQIAKLTIENSRSAGSVHLIDQRSQWRRVGLISNESGQLTQPLLSPLYYIRRALEPFAQIIAGGSEDVAKTVETFTDRNVSVIVMADIGRLIGAPLLRMIEWVEDGGVLVRFAGPHMEKSQDSLLPTPLRQGGRRLGGALSWSKPQKLAAFDDKSPFAGLKVPGDVVVTRQLLADPSRLSDKVFIWGRLQDGTPLVTATREGNGWVVLVHVTANSDWSSLPHSGLFVQMLKRLTQLSTIPVLSAASEKQTDKLSGDKVTTQEAGLKPIEETVTLLSPINVLDGFGRLRKPGAMVEPLAFSKLSDVKINSAHPPGFYGPAGQSVALNLFPKAGPLLPLDLKDVTATQLSYEAAPERSFRAPLFVSALLLLLLDSLIVLWMRGGLSMRSPQAHGLSLLILVGVSSLFFISTPVFAQQESQTQIVQSDLNAALNTHLAYVLTGNSKIDEISRQGLSGLSYVLNRRTAVEPSDPVGINITQDELAFFPILYWPVGPYTPALSEKAAQRVNSYMKQGGMIVFDTKDQNSRIGGLTGEGQTALETLLSKLDIPRLEPVPKGHVLTKSFYLLSQFPGRFQGGDLWVEARSKSRAGSGVETSVIDGVSTILITSNDLASAWAVNENLQPLYPVVPGDRLQREMAYRVGVNIVMYALAGNYKADQVHIPALLERLGQ